MKIDIRKIGVKELGMIVDKYTHTNIIRLGNDLKIGFCPTGMWLDNKNKTIATNKKDIIKYMKENNISLEIEL